MKRQGVKHGCDIYSGGEFLGGSLDILAYSVRVYHVTWRGENS